MLNSANENSKNMELYEWNDRNGGSFMKTICKAIAIADSNNIKNLYKGFPELVDGYVGITKGKTYKDFIKEYE